MSIGPALDVYANFSSYGTWSQNAALFSGVVVWLAGFAAVADPHCILFTLGAS